MFVVCNLLCITTAVFTYVKTQNLFISTLVFLLLNTAFIFVVAHFIQERQASLTHLIKEVLKETLHELNIPIATIKANTTLLKKALPQPQPKSIKRIEKANYQIQKMFDDIQYELEKEVRKRELERFDVQEVLAESIEEFKALYDEFSFSINLKPTFVYADKRGLYNVIRNIFQNAVKYSSKTLQLDIFIQENKLYIKDYGIGIKKEKIALLFSKYYQVNTQKDGFGLGLSLVKKYCDENDIYIQITSKEKEGTTVILDFNKVLV